MPVKPAALLITAALLCTGAVVGLRFVTGTQAQPVSEASASSETATQQSAVRRFDSASKSRNTKRQAGSARSRATSTVLETESDLLPLGERARMQRMSDNLLKRADVDATGALALRNEWRQRFQHEPDRMGRMEIITEMAQLDQPQTIELMMELLAGEQDSGVRQQIVLILGYMHSTLEQLPAVNAALASEYKHCGNAAERLRILEVQAALPTAHSVEFMRAAFSANDATPQERSQAAQGLFQLSRNDQLKVESQMVQQVTERLKTDARSAKDAEQRLLAIRALAAPSQLNRPFFTELLKSEISPENRKFLEFAAQEFPTE